MWISDMGSLWRVITRKIFAIKRHPLEIKGKITSVKYVYLDVVKFTLGRSVEAQEQIIVALNEIVKKAVTKEISATSSSSVIYIPVGDGICIALCGKGVVYDSHMHIALEILRLIWAHNQKISGVLQFEVRIGINENDDNIIIDINGNTNVTGAGVNNAQRIMGCADAGQMLVSRTVYDSLNHREKYMGKFRGYKAKVKHGGLLDVYQYTGKENAGLQTSEPSQFIPGLPQDPRLTKIAAYYFAHSIKNAAYIIDKYEQHGDGPVLRTVLWFLANDSVGRSQSTIDNTYTNEIPETPNNTFDEQRLFFYQLPFHVYWYLGELLFGRDISQYSKYFVDKNFCAIVNKEGRNKLKSEWLDIWNEFGLDQPN
jgi:hypothetical protein